LALRQLGQRGADGRKPRLQGGARHSEDQDTVVRPSEPHGQLTERTSSCFADRVVLGVLADGLGRVGESLGDRLGRQSRVILEELGHRLPCRDLLHDEVDADAGAADDRLATQNVGLPFNVREAYIRSS
jgi:hypothetical protein